MSDNASSVTTSAARKRAVLRWSVPPRVCSVSAAPTRRIGRHQRGQQADGEPGEQRDGGGGPEHARVHADRGHARQLHESRGKHDPKGGKCPIRQDEPGGAPRKREHHALHERLADDAASPGAERPADRHFLPASGGAGQEQRRHVRAGDEEDQGDRAEQHQQRRPRIADERVVQRTQARSVLRVLLGKRR